MGFSGPIPPIVPTNLRNIQHIVYKKVIMTTHGPNQVIDYSLAGALTSAPMWVPILTNLNVIMTTITLVIGLVLGITRLRRDLINRREAKAK